MQLSIKFFLLFILFFPSANAQWLEPFSGAFSQEQFQPNNLETESPFAFNSGNISDSYLSNMITLKDFSGLLGSGGTGGIEDYWDDEITGKDRGTGDPISGIPINNGILLFLLFGLIYTLKKLFHMKKLIFLLGLCLISFFSNAQTITVNRQVLANTSLILELSEISGIPTTCTNLLPAITQISSTNTTLEISTGQIVYKNNWNADSRGADSFQFTINCGGIYTINVNLEILPKPDNVRDADCFLVPNALDWSIKEVLPRSTEFVHNYSPLLTGDIDGDGNIEIIGFYSSSEAGSNQGINIGAKIFNLENNQLQLKKIYPFPSGVTSSYLSGSAIARYNGGSYLVIAGDDGYLYALDTEITNSSQKIRWKSSHPYQDNHQSIHGTIVGIADFNNDGIPEVFTGNRIFSLADGKLLCNGGSNNTGEILHEDHIGYAATAIDIDGDGKLELLAGTQIYKVNIDPVTPTNNSMTVMNDWSLPNSEFNKIPNASTAVSKNGFSIAADIDNDGQLEIVTVSSVATGTIFRQRSTTIYVWKPLPGNASFLIGSYHLSHSVMGATSGSYSNGVPMIGNIDNDGYLEIVFLTNHRDSSNKMYLYALKYNPVLSQGNRIVEKWRMEHVDGSGCTGMSLFDFNQDKVNEIVYRDEQKLYIIDGSGNNAVIKSSFDNILSGTGREFPIIADVDRDGQAEIIVTGWDGVVAGGNGNANGLIRVFKSGGAPWAPARSVWNQYMYNAVNVNEDLTIPRYQLSPKTFLQGTDKYFDTSDDLQPYNAFRMQQTVINQYGVPFFPAPDLSFTSNISHSFSGTGMNISVEISNTGEAILYGPIYISVYKESIASGNLLIPAYEYTGNLIPGQKATINLPELSSASLSGITQLIINLNDNGNGIYPTEECNTENNRLIIPFSDDYYGLPYAVGTTSYFDILKNDAEFSSKTIVDVTTTHTLTSRAGATVSISAPRSEFSNRPGLSYTPKPGFFGIDEVQYSVSGTGYATAGTCYIYVFEAMGRLCEGENIYNIAINDLENDVRVVWRQQINPFSEVTQLIFTGSGMQYFPLDAQVYFNVSTSDEISAFNNRISTNYKLMITPPALYWDKNAMDNNWNNPSNWLYPDLTHAYFVPLKCTDVHIPGQATNYPNLHPSYTLKSYFYDTPECNDITYHFGGETAKPNLLDYERAFVQYNVGYYNLDGSENAIGAMQEGDLYSPATKMKRDQWYALAAPLNKMVTGDFSFGGMPSTWQKGFIETKDDGGIVGRWHSPEANNIIELNESHYYAIAYQVADIAGDDIVGEGKAYHKGLFQTKGIIEIPYFENSTLSAAHRIHQYNNSTKKSTFYYYYYQNAGAPIEWNKKDEYLRDESAYRFIFDTKIVNSPSGKPSFKVTVPANEEIMIGNPFLSSLDFNVFFDENSAAKMDSYYRLYENSAWKEYERSTPAVDINNLIAPMQAFFIQTKGTGNVDLYFPFEASVLRTDVTTSNPHQLRSSEIIQNVLYLTASRKDKDNSIILSLNGNENKENIHKLFYEAAPATPQIYFTDENNQKNAIQYATHKTQIPLGVRIGKGAKTDLVFSNIENLSVESLFLLDKETGMKQDLLKNNAYSFVNNEDAIYSDRFILEIGAYNNSTFIDREMDKNRIDIYQSENQLNIYSSEVINSVELFDIQGKTIKLTDNINSNIYLMDTNLSSGIYLIKTILMNGESQTDKFVIR